MRKIKMFGEKSISALLFWCFVLGAIFLFIIFFLTLPELINDDTHHIIIKIVPLICGLALLIPLILIFNSFRKKRIFTKTSIKYLNLYAISNILVIPFNVLTAISLKQITGFSFFDELIGMLDVFGLNVLLAIFALFISTIFKQGFQVQQENDLTI